MKEEGLDQAGWDSRPNWRVIIELGIESNESRDPIEELLSNYGLNWMG